LHEKIYIVGNGFDRHHEVMSGYDEFLRYLFRVDRLLFRDLITFFSCKNLWGDFEYNLAYLSSLAMVRILKRISRTGIIKTRTGNVSDLS